MEGKRLRSPVQFRICFALCKFFFASLSSVGLYYFSAYMTNTALLPLEIIAVIVSITGIVDIVFSFINGWILEKITLPWGQHRSWLLVGPPLAVVAFIFTFTKIGSDTVAAIIIIAAYLVSSVAWSIAEAAYNSMMVICTDDPGERSQLSIWFGAGAKGSGIVFGIVCAWIINIVTESTGDAGVGYRTAIVAYGVLYVLSYWWLFKLSKGEEVEKRNAPDKVKKIPTLVMLKAVANRSFIFLLIEQLFCYCNAFLYTGTMWYYFNYVLGESRATMGAWSSVRGILSVATAVLIALYLKLFKGKKRAYIFILLGQAVATLCMWFFPATLTNYYIFNAIRWGLFGGTAMINLAFYADCAVYSQWKTKMPCHGFIMSLVAVPTKLGILLKNWIITFGLMIIGFSATAEPSPELASKMSAMVTIVPVVLLIIEAAIFAVGYKLSEADVKSMSAEIAERAKSAEV